jgi:hypothetical protein
MIDRRASICLGLEPRDPQRERLADGDGQRRRADHPEPDMVRLRAVERADVREHEGSLDEEDNAQSGGEQRNTREPGPTCLA